MVNILVYSDAKEYAIFGEYLNQLPKQISEQMQYSHSDCYDDLLKILPDSGVQMVFVMMDGAEGMEGVMASKILKPDASVVWISDDKGFGAQSYRLGCSYFAQKPLSKQIMKKVFERFV